MKVLAIDQSYHRVGFALAEDGELQKCFSYNLSKFKTNTLKRRKLNYIFCLINVKQNPDRVIIERPRLFSNGFIAIQTVIALGSLVVMAVDAFYPTPVYSVDTRSWKAKILGRSNASKEDAVKYIRSLGFESANHDAADAACMALYAFTDTAKLREEK